MAGAARQSSATVPAAGRGPWLARLADERLVLSLLVGLALLARVVSALVVPPWQGPDEPKHYEYARLLLDKREQLLAERRLLDPRDASPTLQRAVIASLAEHRYWERVGWLPAGPTTPAVLPERFAQIWPHGTHTQLHRPSLYYFLGALAILPVAGSDLATQLLALRLLSALLAALTVLATYLAARAVFPAERFVPLVSAAFVAALPMHVFVGGAANNDNLVALWGALVALGLARGFARGFGVGEWLLVLGSLLLALATKRTAVGLLPAVLLAGVMWLLSLRGRSLLAALGFLVGGSAAAAAALLVLPPARLREALVAYALNGIHQWYGLLKVPWGAPEVHALLLRHVAALFASFWGIFGWFNVLLPTAFYVVFAIVSGLCGLGFLYWLGRLAWRQLRAPSATPGAQLMFGVVLLVASIGMVALALAERIPYLSTHELPQGRYLFTALAPLAVVHAVGARALLPLRLGRSPWTSVCLVLGLFALDFVVYAGYLVPFYS